MCFFCKQIVWLCQKRLARRDKSQNSVIVTRLKIVPTLLPKPLPCIGMVCKFAPIMATQPNGDKYRFKSVFNKKWLDNLWTMFQANIHKTNNNHDKINHSSYHPLGVGCGCFGSMWQQNHPTSFHHHSAHCCPAHRTAYAWRDGYQPHRQSCQL